eukprot:3201366-Rhodomonas_salina.6
MRRSSQQRGGSVDNRGTIGVAGGSEGAAGSQVTAAASKYGGKYTRNKPAVHSSVCNSTTMFNLALFPAVGLAGGIAVLSKSTKDTVAALSDSMLLVIWYSN